MEKTITPMVMTGNMPENWKRWRQRFQNYLVASETNTKSEEVQCAQLLHYLGEEAMTIYNTFTFEKQEENKIEILLNKFEQYFVPRKNLTYERYKFFTCKQGEQTIEQFVKQLKTYAQQCEFKELTDDLVKTMLICGMKDDALREKLLQNEDKQLAKVIEACVIWENTKMQSTAIAEKNESKAVDGINVRSHHGSHTQQHGNKLAKNTTGQAGFTAGSQGRSGFPTRDGAKSDVNVKNRTRTPNGVKQVYGRQGGANQLIRNCTNCGRTHSINRCTAFGKVCNFCKGLNHFSYMCRTKSKRINEIDCNNELDCNNLHIDSVEHNCNESWYVNLCINNVESHFKVDTGAQANIIHIDKFKVHKINTDIIFSCSDKLYDYNKKEIHVLGKCKLEIRYKNTSYVTDFYVVNGERKSLISFVTSVRLGLINKIDNVERLIDNNYKQIVNQFKNVFCGIGKVGIPYKIEIKEDSVPVVIPIRKVPFALEQPFKKCLQDMEKNEIIERAEGSSEWLNSFVIVRKGDGSLRICLDPRELNKVIKSHKYKIPTIDEIMSKIKDANIFTTLDATSGFWSIPLDESSSRLCTFGTPYGRFRFKRLPFGIATASEVFQERFRNIFDVEGVQIYVDDVLIYGRNKAEHDRRLKEVLEIAKRHNVKFNLQKCKFGMSEITYLGYTFSGNGVKVDEEKLKAIREMPTPTTKQELQRFLGMVNYIGRFINNLSERTAYLRAILRQKNAFIWGPEQETEFQELRILLTDTPCLRYFNTNKEVVLSVDASKSGLGAVLLQDGRPCAYASRTMTETQQKYAQIEKELLAICFGVDKFHQYIYGRKVTVETDHKPLVPIFKKNLCDCPARLQRMLLKLQKYDLQVIFKPGKDLTIADTLSRANLKEEYQDNLDLETQICTIINKIKITDERLQELVEETKKDEELQIIRKYIEEGWPADKKKIPDCVKSYYKYRNEMTQGRGLIFKGRKILIPRSLRKFMLLKIHTGHFGINKCIQRANTAIFWPGMNIQIEDFIQKCNACQKYGSSKPKEPLILHEIEKLPWFKVGVDLYELHGEVFLLVVDYYSKYAEIISLDRNLTSKNVIQKLKSIFARHGIPAIVITDSGAQLMSAEMQQFAKNWKFQLKQSSPHHQQANGMAERTIGTIKQMLKKTIEENGDIYLALLSYRNTPIYNIYSPSQILMSRMLRDNLPRTKEMLKPKVIHEKEYYIKMNRAREKYKEYYDTRSKLRQEFNENDKVYYQEKPRSEWKRARITEKEDDRTYKIITEEGRILRRNKQFLKRRDDRQECIERQNNIEINIQDEQEIENRTPCPSVTNNINDSKQVTNADTSRFVTRSGREIKTPSKFKDFYL